MSVYLQLKITLLSVAGYRSSASAKLKLSYKDSISFFSANSTKNVNVIFT